MIYISENVNTKIRKSKLQQKSSKYEKCSGPISTYKNTQCTKYNVFTLHSK